MGKLIVVMEPIVFSEPVMNLPRSLSRIESVPNSLQVGDQHVLLIRTSVPGLQIYVEHWGYDLAKLTIFRYWGDDSVKLTSPQMPNFLPKMK